MKKNNNKMDENKTENELKQIQKSNEKLNLWRSETF